MSIYKKNDLLVFVFFLNYKYNQVDKKRKVKTTWISNKKTGLQKKPEEFWNYQMQSLFRIIKSVKKLNIA